MARIWILAALVVACVAAGVAWYVAPLPKPHGYAGLEFSVMTPAAAARAPLLKSRGALILDVADGSPAARAGIAPGEVVAAIDGVPIVSAAQAAGIVRAHGPGDRVAFSLFDEPKGEIQARDVAVIFIGEPPVTKKHSVQPPRTLAKEDFPLPAMAANAAWSRIIARGATIRPLELPGLGAGRCNGVAPQGWFVAGHAADDSMIHVMAPFGFQHAVYQAARLDSGPAQAFVQNLIAHYFQAEPVVSGVEDLPFGFRLLHFGTPKGAAGFAEYRVTGPEQEGARIAVWIAAAAAADIGWAEPQTGAVAFSLHCLGGDPPPLRPRDPRLAPTSLSARCIQGQCGEGDYAAQYMSVLRLGYVHAPSGGNFLVKPKTDFWRNGADGPGYYHQTGGENEKLEPGRSN